MMIENISHEIIFHLNNYVTQQNFKLKNDILMSWVTNYFYIWEQNFIVNFSFHMSFVIVCQRKCLIGEPTVADLGTHCKLSEVIQWIWALLRIE